MKPSKKKIPQLLFIAVLVQCLLITVVKSDCPLQYYPSQTIIGFINAEINNDPQKQNSQQTYVYNLKQSLTTATPNVLIGVNAIQYNVGYELQYRAIYQPTPRFGTLNFKILVQDKENKWRRLQFNFIATNHPQVSANTLQFNQLAQDLNKTKFSLVSKIQLEDYMSTKPIIQTYVSGISLRAKKSRQEMESAMRSVQSLKKTFSWNRGAIAAANKMIEAYSVLAYQIANATLTNKTLTINFIISESIVAQNLTVSYIIFNEMEYPLKNNLIYQSFTLGGTNGTYGFAPLQNTDITFIGFRGAQFKLTNSLQIQFTVARSKGSFNVYPTQTLPEEYFLYVSFFQTDNKFQSQCQNCPESIYRFETFCLDTCPRGYVNIKNEINSTCKYCNISQFLIPNENNTECVCANQYFPSNGSRQCEACHYSCLTCKNISACQQCDSVDKTTKRIFSNQNKFCTCMDGFFDNQNLICEKCHHSCLTCQGPSIYQCTKCKEDRSFDSTKRCQCGVNFIEQAGQCVCKEPNFLLNKVCYSKNPVSSVCSKPNMIERNVSNKTICDCEKGFEMYKNQCISCPKTFALNQQTGRCECSKTAFLVSNNTCVECEAMKYYDNKFEKCLCKKQYFEKEDGTCIDCPQKSKYLDGKCQCVFNYYLQNNACVKCRKTQDDPNCLRIDLNQL